MKSISPINCLVILEVAGSQSDQLMRRLRQAEIYFTVIDSTGGIFQEPMLCLLLGIEQDRMAGLLEIVRQCCRSYKQYIPAQVRLPSDASSLPMVEAQVGGASIHVMRVEQFIQL